MGKVLKFFSQFTSLAPVYNFIGGRHTTFALFFAITAFVLALKGKLTMDYSAVITALQAFVLVHSAKEDYFNNKQ